jgi:hypothetical protein
MFPLNFVLSRSGPDVWDRFMSQRSASNVRTFSTVALLGVAVALALRRSPRWYWAASAASLMGMRVLNDLAQDKPWMRGDARQRARLRGGDRTADRVQFDSEQSFPASDAPGWSGASQR